MTDKELRHLNRRELIDIIYEMKRNEVRLEKRISVLENLLKNRQIQIENAGSIAEAALAISGIFEAAQTAADDYLRAIRSQHETPSQHTSSQDDIDELIEQAKLFYD